MRNDLITALQQNMGYQPQGQGMGGNNYYTPQMPNGMQLAPGMLGAGNPMGAQGGQGGGMGGGLGSQIGGQLGPLLSALFGGGKNPADAGMGYLNQIPGTLKPYYNSYINAGKDAMGTLQGQYGQLINDPGAVMNRIGGGFQQSPGYQFQVGQATNAANNAAAAGGYVGSPQAQQMMAQNIGGLANQDYYNYLNHGMSMYGQGLGGMSHINDMGFDASNQLAQMLGQNLQNQAGLAYQGQNYQNQQQNGLWNALGGLGGSIIGAFL